MAAPSKAEIRRWLKRVRKDVRDLERAIAKDDAQAAAEATEDLNGSAGEIVTLIEDRYPDGPPPAVSTRRCRCGEPEDGGDYGFFDGPDNVTRCNSCGATIS